MNQTMALPPPLQRLRWPAMLVGIVGLGASLFWLYVRPEQGYRSYLLAYTFWLGITLGSLALAMVHHLVGGEWGYLIRRIHEAAALVLPVMLVLFVPLCFGLRYLYPWADPHLLATDPILRYKQGYLNPEGFMIRAGIYFAIWIAFAFTLRRWSLARDVADAPAIDVRLQKLSAAGILLFILTMTAASIDWLMSREPHYTSTIFGFITVVGQALSAMAMAVLLLAWLSDQEPYVAVAESRHFNDLGSLLLTLVILFAYLEFAQYLINWAGNSQEEIPWYVQRSGGGWQWVGLGVILFHFFVPFFLLLSRFNKRNVRIIGRIAALLLIVHLVDIFWTVAPSGESLTPRFTLYWTDLLAPIGMGGIWFACFAWILARRPLLPRYSFGLQEAMAHGHRATGDVA